MLNENKIKMMTKMAIYEKNDGKKMLKNSSYYKSDYIAFGLLKTLVTTTIAYFLCVGIYLICDMENFIRSVNNIGYGNYAKIFIVLYVVMLIGFSVIAILVYNYQYESSRDELKVYFSRLNRLEHFYKNRRNRR